MRYDFHIKPDTTASPYIYMYMHILVVVEVGSSKPGLDSCFYCDIWHKAKIDIVGAIHVYIYKMYASHARELHIMNSMY